jgi:hypothetical protein
MTSDSETAEPGGDRWSTLLIGSSVALLVVTGVLHLWTNRLQLIEDELLIVSCGDCAIEMDPHAHCPWVVEIDGEYREIEGAVPTNHESHASGGMCAAPKEALISGELRGGTLTVSSMELDPVHENAADAPVHDHAH